MVEHQDDDYRAVGRYFVVFSRMIFEIRERLEWHFRRPGESGVAELMFSEATAQPIANAFFGVCRLLSEHDPDEVKAAKELRKGVNNFIEQRNLLAHADLYVGNTSGTAGVESTARVPPFTIRWRPLSSDGPMRSDDQADLDQESDAIEDLTKHLREYGMVCSHRHGLQRGGQKMRVRDVVLLDDDKQLVPGPKALWARSNATPSAGADGPGPQP